MPSVIDGSASATFQTPLPVAQGGTGGTTSVGTGSAVMLSGQTGSAPVFGARAWCVFNGTTAGTNAPTAGGNVTSVTRNGAGDYTINFTTAMPDANYAATLSIVDSAAVTNPAITVDYNNAPTSSALRIKTKNGAGTATDFNQIHVAIFR